MNTTVEIPAFDAAKFEREVTVSDLRLSMEFTQAQFAEEIGHSRASIARWENGDPIPLWAQKRLWQLHHELKLGLRVAASKAEGQ